ncbi:MAG: hypothetical protein ABSH51_23915 [Solirubrobacteraceae bacterium]|jgi:hypothetical protein
MQTRTDSLARRIANRVRHMIYATGRMFQLRAGIWSSSPSARHHQVSRARLDQLEALWALEAYAPDRTI